MKYMKKPGVVEAFQITADRIKNTDEWPEWLWVSFAGEERPGIRVSDSGEQVMVLTKKGAIQIYVDDWMIKTVEGDIRSCDPFVFADEYMMVTKEQEEAFVRVNDRIDSWVGTAEIQQKTAEYYKRQLVDAHALLGRVIHQYSLLWDSVNLGEDFPTDNPYHRRNFENPTGTIKHNWEENADE